MHLQIVSVKARTEIRTEVTFFFVVCRSNRESVGQLAFYYCQLMLFFVFIIVFVQI